MRPTALQRTPAMLWSSVPSTDAFVFVAPLASDGGSLATAVRSAPVRLSMSVDSGTALAARVLAETNMLPVASSQSIRAVQRAVILGHVGTFQGCRPRPRTLARRGATSCSFWDRSVTGRFRPSASKAVQCLECYPSPIPKGRMGATAHPTSSRGEAPQEAASSNEDDERSLRVLSCWHDRSNMPLASSTCCHFRRQLQQRCDRPRLRSTCTVALRSGRCARRGPARRGGFCSTVGGAVWCGALGCSWLLWCLRFGLEGEVGEVEER